MAETKNDTAADRKKAAERLAADREAREKAREERDKRRGRPTPTQEEADLAALGQHPELSPDGSPEEKPAGHQTRHMEAGSSGGSYHTRQSTPQPNKANSSA